MSIDDSALYTGVDGVQDGVFGNEKLDESTQAKLDEQKRQLAELTPKLQDIVDMIDREKAIVIDFIVNVVDSGSKDIDVTNELKAAGRYRKYLDELKTKFKLALQETK